MKVVSTFHQPSSVTSSLKCSLTSDSELGHLVVAKANRIEVSSITPEGLDPACSLEIWGRVLSIKAIPGEDPTVSNLLVLLDHPHPKLLLLEYTSGPVSPALSTTWSADLYDRHSRAAEFFTNIVTTTFGEVAVTSCYIGKLKVLYFDKGKVRKDFDVIIPELNLLSLSFMETNTETYTLAILHIDHLQRVQLLARDLDIESQELSTIPSLWLQRAVLPSSSFPDVENQPILVPVPSFSLDPSTASGKQETQCLGGVLVLGGRKVIFVEAATDAEQKHEKGKEKRQQQRQNSGSEKNQRQAKQKEKEREAKRVKSRATVKWPWGEVTAWCPADDDGRRFFVGDMFGRLGLLTITSKPELVLLPLGEISAPTTLSYLSSQVLFVGSHTGDSQVIRIHPTAQSRLDEDTLPIPSNISVVSPSSLSEVPRSTSPYEDEDIEMEGDESKRSGKSGKIIALKGTHIEVLDQIRNIAPITDAVMADTDQSGQPQIFTCSGHANTGALNVVRTGADFHELTALKDIPNVIKIFPIRNSYDDQIDTHILVSTLHGSHLLRIDGRDTFTHIDKASAGFDVDQPTLALANIPRRVQKADPAGALVSSYVNSAYIIQVTPKGVNLLEYDTILRIFNRIGTGWVPDRGASRRGPEIVAADLNASQFVVALSGGSVVVLNFGFNGQLEHKKTREFPGKEISALSCTPLDPTKKFALYIAVAFWESSTIQLLSLKDEQSYLAPFCDSPPLPAIVRSVVLHNFGQGKKSKDADFRPYVVAGLADGSVTTMSFQEKELKDLKFFPLGSIPVALSVTVVDGKRNVFANGSRAAVFYWERQRLCQSSVMLKDVTVGANLNTAQFSSCLILATSSSLVIGQIRGIDKMQIRSIPLGLEIPRRIAHHSEHNIFGVACADAIPYRIGETSPSNNTFNLIDSTSFTRLRQFECETDEQIVSVLSLSGAGISAQGAFCVGTVRMQLGEFEPSLGRLMLFDVDGPERDLKLIATEQTDGCVYAITTVNGLIATAVNTSVDLYHIIREDETVKFSRVARWNHNYCVTSLVARGDNLIVGDSVSSVSVLKVHGRELQTLARDYAPLWPNTIESTRNEGVIGANLDCNLFTLRIQEVEGRKRLERDGHYHIGENVTKFITGGLSIQDSHESRVFEPEHIFFTSSGRIGVVLHVADDVALQLTSLQRNMAAAIVGPGEVNHTKWRAPSSSRGISDGEPSYGFLDGDFLEQFLTHSSPDQLLKGKHRAEWVGVEKKEVEEILERLQSLH
ncbi:hypothetical protein BDW22DRAFT_1363933 [Trametopsis cervina]|nr:hypothetical protein BDW22DRAFT_1363933 [Trametopsis cervina]